jgi:hypothetical protein
MSWSPVDLGPIIAGVQAGEIVGPVPGLMARTDGACLLYPGEVHELHGEPETCKGWIVLSAISPILRTAPVLYLDFEDSPASIVGRLLALGTPSEAILARFTYMHPCDPFKPNALTPLLNVKHALAVIDGLSEAYGLLGFDPYSNADAAKFLAALPRPIAERGTAVLEIDHVVKSKETRGRYALGAQHKLAGIAAAYSTEIIKTPSRTDAGIVKLKIEKDRHGHVRSHADGHTIALAHITPTDNGQHVSVTLEPPDATATATGDFRPTVLMAKVARYVADEPGASQNSIRKNVSGKAEWLDIALRRLIDEGYIERHQDGRTYHHHVVKPFDQFADHVPVSQVCPNRVPDTPRAGVSRVPPLKGRDTTRHTPSEHDTDIVSQPDGRTLDDLEALAAEYEETLG